MRIRRWLVKIAAKLMLIMREFSEDVRCNMKGRWAIIIERGENGYVIKYPGDSEYKEEEMKVVEILDDNCGEDEREQESRAMQKLLQGVRDYFGYYASNHEKFNTMVILANEDYKEIEE